MRLLGVTTLVLAVAVTVAAAGGRGPKLRDPHPCPFAGDFTCATLRVPLDYGGGTPRTLDLAVSTAANANAPRGVLLVLAGGPGQPAAASAPRVAARLGTAVAKAYRIVTFDQRGTGGTALRCPALQRQMGFSDLIPPTPAAVRACAATVGSARSFYGTDDVVRDIDALRRALGASRLTLDGISYGTYVAERYALAHPGHVARLVLDSVVPHRASAQLETLALPQVARVLRLVCAAAACPGDPVADLAADVARYRDGPQLLDAIVVLSVFDPTYRSRFDLPRALHEARLGTAKVMNRMLAAIHAVEAAYPADQLSQGLHASALCGDWTFPWGDSSAPLAGRLAALRRYAASLPKAAFFPFDRATVTDDGIMQQCLYWPPTPPTPQPPPGAKLPPVPTLLLAGDRDLSTPLPWPRMELRLAPRGRLVVVHGFGHSTQRNPAAHAAVEHFLLGG